MYQKIFVLDSNFCSKRNEQDSKGSTLPNFLASYVFYIICVESGINILKYTFVFLGVKIIDGNTIISTSIDKRINLWKWCFEENSFSVTLTASKMSLIPDIANLECWKAR